eukprot:GHVS01103199.1.p1 GENE.GHVS01103199.1~~GHVS01103199.1.p1  ORF type:complete len:183 (+),score=26.58 GHVS01103199.1:195-743(+)
MMALLLVLLVLISAVVAPQDSVEPIGCGECPPSSSPVCGSNHITYKSVCELQRDSCIYGASLTVLFHNACEEEESTPLGGTGCTEACLGRWAPVCGTDHRNYSSMCVMEKDACRLGIAVEVKHKGLCTPDERPIDLCVKSCSTAVAPVCGTDDLAYVNECVLLMTSCRERRHIQVKNTGMCT